MAALKVLHLVTTVEQGKGLGGAEKLILFLLDKIDKTKYEFIIGYHVPDWCKQNNRTEVEELFQSKGAKVYVFKTRSKFDLLAVFELRRLFKELNPDIVHSHQPRLDFLGGIAAKLDKIPFVITRHLSICRSPINEFKKPCFQFFDSLISARIAKKIIAVSQEIKEDLITVQKICSKKIITVYNGIDSNKFAAIQKADISIRKELNLDDALLVGVVARINEQKGHTYFLQTAAKVKTEVPTARFLIVGDGPLKAQVEKQAKELGLREIIFTGYRSDIPEILFELDVVALSSLSEGLPVVILEAMAMSKVVAAFDVGGVKEVVEDEKTGIIVEVFDVDALATAVIKLLKDEQLRLKMGAAGKIKVDKQFSLNAMLGGYLEVYNNIHV